MSMQGGDEMELGKQIKMHRQEAHLSQEELANRVYVSRQTISNWENDKSYPDVNSLVLLSEIFQISLDNLIKGDIEVMKDVIQKEEIEKMNRYGKSYTIMLIATAVSAVPLFMWLGVWAFIPWGIIWAISMYFEYQNHITDVLANAFNSNDKKATPIQQLSVEYNFESCEGIETCQLVTVIAEFSAIYGNKNKNIDKSYGSPGGYDGEVIETMEDLFLLALFEIYTNCVL